MSEQPYVQEFEPDPRDAIARFIQKANDRKMAQMPRPTFYAGLDFGKQGDYSALTIIEKRRPTLWIRYASRFPLGMSYPDQVAKLRSIIGRQSLGPSVKLILDRTGVGEAACDLITRAISTAEIIPVTITSGRRVTLHKDGSFGTPKKDLVSTLRMLIDSGQLRIAEKLRGKAVLEGELKSFQIQFNQHGHAKFESPSGEHDDLVLSLALACWFAENEGKFDTHKPFDPLLLSSGQEFRIW